MMIYQPNHRGVSSADRGIRGSSLVSRLLASSIDWLSHMVLPRFREFPCCQTRFDPRFNRWCFIDSDGGSKIRVAGCAGN